MLTRGPQNENFFHFLLFGNTFQKFVCLIPSNTTVQKRSFVPIVNLSYLDPAATAALRKELVLEAAAFENIEVGWSHKKPEDQ